MIQIAILSTLFTNFATSNPVYRATLTVDFKNSCVVGYQNFDTLLLKLSPVLKRSTHPLQNQTCSFPLTSLSQELCPQTYLLSLPLN